MTTPNKRNAELTGVERPAIAWLVKLGFSYLPGKSIAGKGVAQTHRTQAPIIEDVLIAQLERLNPWLKQLPNGASQAIRLLRNIWAENSDLMAANQAFWHKVLFQSDLQLKDHTGRVRSVHFIDQHNPYENSFTVVDQYVGKNANDDIFRPDLLLFINGLPLAIVECKRPSISLDKAIGQMDGYQNSHAAHFAFNMVCVAINRRAAKYGAIFAPKQFYLSFKFDPKRPDEKNTLDHIASLVGRKPSEQDKLLWALFEPQRFVRLVCFYPLYEREEGTLVKKLPRYQQLRAVEKSIARLQGKDPAYLGQSIGGTVWHTQGSGKSLTMALLTRLLRSEVSGFDNPSILVLTDRTDLDRQIHTTFTNVGIVTTKASSVEGLKQMLTNDYGAVFTATVQKFQESEGKPIAAAAQSEDPDSNGDSDNLEQQNRSPSRVRRVPRKDAQGNETYWIVKEINLNFGLLDDDGNAKRARWHEQSATKVDFSVLSNKANFFVLVDEAHRSQYGFLAAFMRSSLPQAKFIAFTGTPLQDTEKSTLKEFGGTQYIDTYRIDEAVSDNATLPIKYREGMSEWYSDGKLQQRFDDEFADKTDSEKSLLKAQLIKQRRNAKNRISENTDHLIEHFLLNVKAKGFKAMLVCDGRDMAIKYKDTLDARMRARKEQGLPTFASRVVISLGSITDKRTGVSEQQAYQQHNQQRNQDQGVEESAEENTIQEPQGIYQVNKKLETIEERLKRELKAGLAPVCVPSDKIAELTNNLFKLPYGDEQRNKKNQKAQVNNIGLMIVSDMLLTGWDAPIVSTLYLDKPLQKHSLLQAIARVNRVRKGKNAGYIVDYYGVVEHLDEALKLYGSDVLPEQIWTDTNAELPKLKSAMYKVLDILPNQYNLHQQRDDYIEDADLFLDPDVRLDIVEDFLAAVSEFNQRLDIVLPDERGAPYKPYFEVFNELKLALRQKLPGAADKARVTAVDSALLKDMLDQHIQANPVKSLLGRDVSILDAAEMENLKRQKGIKGAALVMKNQTSHTIRTGKVKDPVFYNDLEQEFEQLLEDEKAGRLEQIEFLKQLEAFSERMRKKDAQATNAGFTSPTQIAIFNYLKAQVNIDQATAWTNSLYSDQELSRTLATPLWKKQDNIHPQMKQSIRKILRGLAGWDTTTARQHANEIFKIILVN